MLLPAYSDDKYDYDFYDLLHYFDACAYYYYRLYYDDSLSTRIHNISILRI